MKKIQKNVKNCQKIQKKIFFSKIQNLKKKSEKKPKKNPHSFSILGIGDPTRALQSSLILRKKFGKISKKPFFKKSKIFDSLFLSLKKMQFYQFGHLRRLVFNQSSLVHPISESRGVTLSVTQEPQEKQDGTSLFLIQDSMIDNVQVSVHSLLLHLSREASL